MTMAYQPEEFPGGLLCMDCDYAFELGEQYSQRLTDMSGGGDFIIEVVCVPCGLGIGGGTTDAE